MFFERFEQLCYANNTTTTKVTKDLGYSTGSLSHWKKGGVPKGDIIVRLADYFGVTTDYLLGQSTSITPDNNERSPNKELYEIMNAKNGIYFRLAKSAKDKDLDLNEEDLDFIIEFMKRGQKQ